MTSLISLGHVLLGLVLAPLLPGVINKTKALVAGRRGAPLLQLYYDLYRLTRKGAVFSSTTTGVFRLAPPLSVATVVLAMMFLPFGRWPSVLSFSADFILFAYILALGRFMTILAALDTGSSFEAMGASREAFFSALAEPALVIGFVTLSRLESSLTLSDMLLGIAPGSDASQAPLLVMVAIAFFVVLVAENSRIPVDDPNTHLELTMVHEVMILDHSGPDLALIEYGAALKLWLFASLIVAMMLPVPHAPGLAATTASLAGLGVIGVLVGTIESTMARLPLVRVPQLLVGASLLSLVALTLVLQ